jgi:GT2 family glycosyltransferase
MKIAVSIPLVVPHKHQKYAFEAILGQTVDVEILIIQNSEEVGGICNEWVKKTKGTLHNPGRNIGVSASWNYGCKWAFENGYDQVLLLADDYILKKKDILEGLSKTIEKNPKGMYYFRNTDGKTGFATFAISKDAWTKTGPFDEGFWPGGYEDFDYLRRCKAPSLYTPIVADHVRGRVVRKGTWLEKLIAVSGPLNGMRFSAKWGGNSQGCAFTEPWGGRDPYCISIRDLMRNIGLLDGKDRLRSIK